jgi:hypothetical protein
MMLADVGFSFNLSGSWGTVFALDMIFVFFLGYRRSLRSWSL